MLYYFPKYTGEASIPSYFFSTLNGKMTGDSNSRPLTYTSAFTMPNTIHNVSGNWLTIIKNGIRYESRSFFVGTQDVHGFGTSNFSGGYVIDDQIGTIKTIGFAMGLAYAGCKFILYGVRA